MSSLSKPIVLIGFKHTGKTVIGKSLAHLLNVPFIDLDQQVESMYEIEFKKMKSCREIMYENGENFFRDLENKALTSIIHISPSVISSGGGAPVNIENQILMKSCLVIHVTSFPHVVFERIQNNGQPAFFNSEQDLLKSFEVLWNERQPIYERIRNFAVENNSTIDDAVMKIFSNLNAIASKIEEVEK